MKELSIEQKAQRYDEAIERAKGVIEQNPLMEYLKKGIEYIFPELKESEDEKIRKELIAFLKENHETGRADETWSLTGIERWIAWLEKQGEQKHKIQPKFKIGDIIRFKGNDTLKGEAETHKIVRYDNELYVFDDGTTDLFCEQDLYELVEQKPAKLSEEDESRITTMCTYLQDYARLSGSESRTIRINEYCDWLKSLRPQSTWKPSDNELEVLRLAAEKDGTCLMGLYEKLKKLRKE